MKTLERETQEKIKITKEGSPSCALNNTKESFASFGLKVKKNPTMSSQGLLAPRADTLFC